MRVLLPRDRRRRSFLRPIHQSHIDHNAPCLPPPPSSPRLNLHNHCFQFLLGVTVVPREIELCIFFGRGKGGGINRVHHGLCENGEYFT